MMARGFGVGSSSEASDCGRGELRTRHGSDGFGEGTSLDNSVPCSYGYISLFKHFNTPSVENKTEKKCIWNQDEMCS